MKMSVAFFLTPVLNLMKLSHVSLEREDSCDCWEFPWLSALIGEQCLTVTLDHLSLTLFCLALIVMATVCFLSGYCLGRHWKSTSIPVPLSASPGMKMTPVYEDVYSEDELDGEDEKFDLDLDVPEFGDANDYDDVTALSDKEYLVHVGRTGSPINPCVTVRIKRKDQVEKEETETKPQKEHSPEKETKAEN